jgi:hypothetical protein
VRPFVEWPIVRQLHERGLLFPAGLVLVAVAVLAQGARQQGSQPVAELPPAPSPTPSAAQLLPRLRPDLEKTPLSYLSDYWLQLGERARPSLLRLGQAGWPAVVVAPGLAVTSPEAGQALRAENGATGEPALEVDLRDPDLAFVTFDAATGGEAFALAPLEEVSPGSLVATISIRPDGRLRITPAHVVSIGVPQATDPGEPVWGTPPGTLLELSIVPAGLTTGAVVDLDGGLLALAVAARGAELRLLPAALVLEAAQRDPKAPCRALAVAPLARGVRELVGRDGVVVEAVREDAFAEAPGVEAGDVLLEWDGAPVEDAAAFAARYDAALGKPARLLLLRDGTRLRATLTVPGADCGAPLPAPVRLDALGLVLRWAEELETPAWQVASVRPASAAATAGLRAGDRLLAVSGRPVGGEQARPVLEALARRRRPTLLEIGRGGRVTLRALPTPRPVAPNAAAGAASAQTKPEPPR